MKSAGFWLMAIGAVVAIGSFFYQPTVNSGYLEQETYNLGKLQFQLMLMQAGLASEITGAVLFAVGSLLERLERSGVIEPEFETLSSPQENVSGELVACAWCNRSVRTPMVPCSSVEPENRRDRFSRVESAQCLENIRKNDPDSLNE